MKLTFVESEDGYSIYRNPENIEVYVADGRPLRFLVEFELDWMVQQWEVYCQTISGVRRNARQPFLDLIRTKVIDPDEVDNLRFCEDCDAPSHEDDGSTVQGGDFACESCRDNYYTWCDSCEEYVAHDDTNSTVNDTIVCDSCCSASYHYCEECEGYYHSSRQDEHEHDETHSKCCESPQRSFTVRNDGQPALQNDTRVKVSLAAGVIDDEGIGRIQSWLNDDGRWELAQLIAELDPKVQTTEGNFTKRLSKAAAKKRKQYTESQEKMLADHGEYYRDHHADVIERLKTPPRVLSMVGTIAGEHSRAVDFVLDVTRDLNLPAEEFAHEGSCWWTSHYIGRCALKTNGGFGLRTFSEENYGYVTGRAWVMPLKQDANGNLSPTFETMEPDAFVVFNCYEELQGYNACRIVSHMAGMTYRKISFYCSPMYVNEGVNLGSVGFLVAPEHIAEKYTDGELSLRVDQHSTLFQREAAAAARLAAEAAALIDTKELAHV